MTQADRIRAFVVRKFFTPATRAGRPYVTIKSGDVHRMMGLSNAYPAVCSALRGGKLQSEAGVTFLGQEGPLNGANVLFRYDLSGSDSKMRIECGERLKAEPTVLRSQSGLTKPFPSLAGALALVSCSKAKLNRQAPACELYCSPAFQMKRRIIEKSGSPWLILSAKHGLVEPDAQIAPYDLTLNTMRVAARRAWAHEVIPLLLERANELGRVVMFAGQTYTQYLVGGLAAHGIAVSEPLRGMRQGEQLAWLSRHQ